MLSNSELKILKFIKYAPAVFLTILSVFITSLFFYNKYIDYKNNLSKIEKEFISINKNKVKKEVDRIYDYILYEKINSEKKLKLELKDRVNALYKVINTIYQKYKNKESKEEILERIKDYISSYRFNEGRGYFYVNSLDGQNLIHPILPNLIGKNLINIQDKKGKYLVRELVKNLKVKDEYYSIFYWNKPKDKNNEYKKISFNKVFRPLNIYFGTGEYLYDFEKILQKRILNYINSYSYDKNGYVFVFDYKGLQLAHIKKSYVGLNRLNLKDANGLEITKMAISLGKEGDGFMKYIGTIKPQTKLPAEKTTYVKGLNQWQWVMGSGFYTDELQAEIKATKIHLQEKMKKEFIELVLICLILFLLALILSVSISKRLEKHFYMYKKELSSQIKRSRQKDSLLAQQSKMAAMGEMLANIAHQWRQPLNTISTIATGIKFKYDFDTVEKVEVIEGMDRISASSKYLSQTIEDFRDFLNPQKELSNFDLKEAINKALILIASSFTSKNILIKKDLQSLNIRGCKNELIQVLINILNNSKDELEKKELEEKLILIELKESNNKAFLSIKDNAGGIPKELLAKIFEAYFTTKDKEGTGLGLHMSKEIIEKHMQGSLEVENKEFSYNDKKYKGACFTIGLSID